MGEIANNNLPMDKKSMNSDEAPAKRVRRTMENDTPNFVDDNEYPMKLGDVDYEPDDAEAELLPMHCRPEAPNVDAFMQEPYKYRPRDEYLSGTHIVEVSSCPATLFCSSCPFLRPFSANPDSAVPLFDYTNEHPILRTKRYLQML